MSDELVDIVDDDDNVIATVTRSEMRAHRLQHRSVGIAVFSGYGRLLIHRRSDTKDIWPGWWDIAAGGVVVSGESYEEAAHRELAEELGITDVTIEFLGRGHYVDHDLAAICKGYRIVHDGPFTFADGEVAETRWVTFDELDTMRATHRFLPDSTALLLPLLRP